MLTPMLCVRSTDADRILCLEDVELATFLDAQPVTKPSDYLVAVTTLMSMYWTFDVQLPKSLARTIAFLAGHVCQLETFKITPAMQKVLN